MQGQEVENDADMEYDWYYNVKSYYEELHPVFIVEKNPDLALARLYPEVQGQEIPFCLTEIDGFALLYHSIYSLYLFGIDEFTIITIPAYENALESFITNATNSQNLRAEFCLNYSRIDLLVSENPFSLLKVPAERTENLLIINASVFYYDIPERLSYWHRKHDATMSLIFDESRVEKPTECPNGACILSTRLDTCVSTVEYFKTVAEENLGENCNNQLIFYHELIESTSELQLYENLPAIIILASEIVPYICVSEFSTMSIFGDLVEFLVEESEIDPMYEHPVIQNYINRVVSSKDEVISPQFGDLFTEIRQISVIEIELLNLDDEVKELEKVQPLTLKELEPYIENQELQIYEERRQNKNCSFIIQEYPNSFEEISMCSIAEASGICPQASLPIMQIIIRPNTVEELLHLNELLRQGLIYPNQSLALKFTSIDAEILQISTPGTKTEQKSKQQQPYPSSLEQSGSHATEQMGFNTVEHIGSRPAVINLRKIDSIFELAKDDIFLLGGLAYEQHYDDEWREDLDIYCKQFDHSKSSTLGQQIELGENVEISDSFIGNNVIIQSGSSIKNCIILEHSKIEGIFRNCIIGKNVEIHVKSALNCVIGCNINETILAASVENVKERFGLFKLGCLNMHTSGELEELQKQNICLNSNIIYEINAYSYMITDLINFVSRPLVTFEESPIIENTLNTNQNTSLLSCLSLLQPSYCDIRIEAETLEPFMLKRLSFRYCLEDKKPLSFTYEVLKAHDIAFKVSNKLESYYAFLNEFEHDFADIPLLRLFFVSGEENYLPLLEEAFSEEIFVVMDFKKKYELTNEYINVEKEKNCKIFVMEPDTEINLELSEFSDYALAYYEQNNNVNNIVTNMLMQLQNAFSAIAGQKIADCVEKVLFTTNCYLSLKNILFQKKPEGYGQYNKEEINLYAGDLLSMCDQCQNSIQYYEIATKSKNEIIQYLAHEKILRLLLLQAVQKKNFMEFLEYSDNIINSIRNSRNFLYIVKRLQILVFLGARESDSFYPEAGYLILEQNSTLENAVCNLHAYNFFIKFGYKELQILYTAGKLFSENEQFSLSIAVCNDLIKKLARLKAFEVGKEAVLELQAYNYELMGDEEKAVKIYEELVGKGQKCICNKINMELCLKIYENIGNQIVELNNIEVIVNNLSCDMVDYSNVKKGIYSRKNIEELLNLQPEQVFRAYDALNHQETEEINILGNYFEYKMKEIYYGIDMQEFDIDPQLHNNELCSSEEELLINHGLFSTAKCYEELEIESKDNLKLLIVVSNLMKFSNFAFEKVEIVSEFEKHSIEGNFHIIANEEEVIVFEFEILNNLLFTELIFTYNATQIIIPCNIELTCEAYEHDNVIDIPQRLKIGELVQCKINTKGQFFSCNNLKNIIFSKAELLPQETDSQNNLLYMIKEIFNETNPFIIQAINNRGLRYSELLRQILIKLQYNLIIKQEKTDHLVLFKANEENTFEMAFFNKGQYLIKFYIIKNGRVQILNYPIVVENEELEKPRLVYHGMSYDNYIIKTYIRNEETTNLHAITNDETINIKNGIGVITFSKNINKNERFMHKYYNSCVNDYLSKNRKAIMLAIDEKLKQMENKEYLESSELKDIKEQIISEINQEKSQFIDLYYELKYEIREEEFVMLYNVQNDEFSVVMKQIQINSIRGFIYTYQINDDTVTLIIKSLRSKNKQVHIEITDNNKCLFEGESVILCDVSANATQKLDVRFCGECNGSTVKFFIDNSLQTELKLI